MSLWWPLHDPELLIQGASLSRLQSPSQHIQIDMYGADDHTSQYLSVIRGRFLVSSSISLYLMYWGMVSYLYPEFSQLWHLHKPLVLRSLSVRLPWVACVSAWHISHGLRVGHRICLTHVQWVWMQPSHCSASTLRWAIVPGPKLGKFLNKGHPCLCKDVMSQINIPGMTERTGSPQTLWPVIYDRCHHRQHTGYTGLQNKMQ